MLGTQRKIPYAPQAPESFRRRRDEERDRKTDTPSKQASKQACETAGLPSPKAKQSKATREERRLPPLGPVKEGKKGGAAPVCTAELVPQHEGPIHPGGGCANARVGRLPSAYASSKAQREKATNAGSKLQRQEGRPRCAACRHAQAISDVGSGLAAELAPDCKHCVCSIVQATSSLHGK